jgi:hypothetical protein
MTAWASALPAPVLKQPFATLIEGITAAAALQTDEQTLHGFGPIDYRLEFGQFLLRQFLPAGRCPGTIGKAEKQLPDFTQAEAGFPRALYHGKPVKNGHIVPSLPADSLGRRKYSNLFVIADSRGPNSDHSRHLRNGQLRHPAS